MTMTKPKTPRRALTTPSRRSFLLSSSAAATTFFIGGKALAADPEFVVKLGTTAPAGTPWEKALKSWKRRVKEATGGRVKVKAYWGGALGDEVADVGEHFCSRTSSYPSTRRLARAFY